MMYIDVTDRTLRAARPGIELVEELLQDSDFPLFLYGLTSKADVLLAAEASLADAGGGSLAELAIALRCGKEAMSLLFGSGLELSDQNFSYLSGSDGVRTKSLHVRTRAPRVIATDFTRLALADSDAWLDEYLAQYGTDAQAVDTVARAETPAVKSSTTATLRDRFRNSIDDFLS